MEITKSQKRLLIILGVVVVYAVYDFISNAETYKVYYNADEEQYYEEQSADSTKHSLELETSKKDAHYSAEWGKDPFYISSFSKTSFSKKRRVQNAKLSLHAISFNGISYVALINEKIVKTGDMITGYTVNKITDSAVFLSSGKKKIVLKLKMN